MILVIATVCIHDLNYCSFHDRQMFSSHIFASSTEAVFGMQNKSWLSRIMKTLLGPVREVSHYTIWNQAQHKRGNTVCCKRGYNVLDTSVFCASRVFVHPLAG